MGGERMRETGVDARNADVGVRDAGADERGVASADQDAGADVGARIADAAGQGQPAEPTSKRPKKKWPVVVGVVAVVLVAAGAGFWTWHEQPSFCNAICHEPMDPYVEGYYGNDALEAHAHQVEGVTCLNCHEAKLDEQVREGMAWITGDYEVGEDGMIATVGVRSDAAMCATSGCHDYAEVVAATADWGGEAGVNPHESHQGYALDCSSCHVEHGTSIMYCNTCHDYEVPTRWDVPARAASTDAQIQEL